MQQLRPEEVVDWLSLRQAIPYLKQITSNTYTVQTLYNWAKHGWLTTNGFRPLKTTRKLLRQCAEQHLGLRLER